MRLVSFAINLSLNFFRRHLSRHSSVTREAEVRVRFAPSPTGQLHLGGLRTALYNYLFSRKERGKFILRIEDTDQSRLVPGAVEQIIDMLQWTGIEIDEGPIQGGNYGPYIQSERILIYKDHVQKLLENESAYRCFCSTKRLDLLRKQMSARGETPKYDNRCRHLTSSAVQEKLLLKVPYVIRFKLEPHSECWHDVVYGPISYDVASIEGDPILMKSDGFPTYHLANVIDDHLMRISHVLRGVEWQVSTTKHILLYKAFGWNPPSFAHLPLLQNKDGKKLSKRQNDVQVEHYKNEGYFSEAVLNLLTNMGSGFNVQQTAGMDMEQLIEHFDLEKLNTNSTRVNFDKLLEFNRIHLKEIVVKGNCRRKTIDIVNELRNKVLDKFNQTNSNEHLKKFLTDAYLRRVLLWSKDRINLVSDLLQPQYNFLWTMHLPLSCNDDNEKMEDYCDVISYEMIQTTLSSVATINDSDYNRDSVLLKLNENVQKKSWKFNEYMKLLRRIITGCVEGPSVAEIMSIIGKETAINRLQEFLKKLTNETERTEKLKEKSLELKDIV